MSTLSLSRSNFKQVIGVAVFAIACLVSVIALQSSELDRRRASQQIPSAEEIQRAEEAERAQLALLRRMPSLGFDNMIANLTFLQFLQYFGDTPARNQTNYSLSPEYFEVILDRDPRFLQAYFFLSGSTTLYAGMPERTVEILERSLQQLSPHNPPGSYYIWRYKGTDELLFLGQPEAAKLSFARAAAWASMYSDPESQAVAEASRQTAEFLEQNPNSRSAQISAWSTVLTNAFDANTQELAITRIEALGGQVSRDEQGRLQISLPPEDSVLSEPAN